MTPDDRHDMEPLRRVKAPAGFTDRVLAACAADDASRRTPFHRRPAALWRAAGLGLAAVLAVLMLTGRVRSPGERPQASTAPSVVPEKDLQQARRQLGWTLAVTTGVIDRSSDRALRDIFDHRLPDAINRSLHQTFDPNRKGRS